MKRAQATTERTCRNMSHKRGAQAPGVLDLQENNWVRENQANVRVRNRAIWAFKRKLQSPYEDLSSGHVSFLG